MHACVYVCVRICVCFLKYVFLFPCLLIKKIRTEIISKSCPAFKIQLESIYNDTTLAV